MWKCNRPRLGFELVSISYEDNHYTTGTFFHYLFVITHYIIAKQISKWIIKVNLTSSYLKFISIC